MLPKQTMDRVPDDGGDRGELVGHQGNAVAPGLVRPDRHGVQDLVEVEEQGGVDSPDSHRAVSGHPAAEGPQLRVHRPIPPPPHSDTWVLKIVAALWKTAMPTVLRETFAPKMTLSSGIPSTTGALR